jgi:hypothetical protein
VIAPATYYHGAIAGDKRHGLLSPKCHQPTPRDPGGLAGRDGSPARVSAKVTIGPIPARGERLPQKSETRSA